MFNYEHDRGEEIKLEVLRCKEKSNERENRIQCPLIYVKYRDHILFKNMRPENVRSCIREAVGWLHHQDSVIIILLMDRDSNPKSSELIGLTSGLGILRETIIRITDLSFLILDKLTSSKGLDIFWKKSDLN